MGQLASYAADKGVDDQNLGHWAWTQLKGCQGPPTRIVLVYVPCQSTGEETVYRQKVFFTFGGMAFSLALTTSFFVI